MTFVIVFAFILCWSPYMMFDLLQVYQCIPMTQTTTAIASLVQSLSPLNSAANPIIYCIFSSRVFVSLRNLPPYKWLWCWRDSGSGAADSRAHTELLTSSHRRTRRDLTIKVKEDSIKQGPQRLASQRSSARQVRLRLPADGQHNHEFQANPKSQQNSSAPQHNNHASQQNSSQRKRASQHNHAPHQNNWSSQPNNI